MTSSIIKSAPFLPSSGDNFREEKRRKYWSERFLLKVYIIVYYFSLIIFSTVELTSFATRECAHYNRHCEKEVREKSRECHNQKPQPFPDPKRKRKPTNLNKHKPNKRTKSTKISSLFPKRGNCNTKRTEKTQEQNDTRKDIQQIAS